MTRFGLVLFVAAASMSAQVKITYLANEGVLLTGPNAKVLIDALFRDSLGDYVRHSPATQQQLETGKPPFDGITLALATHYHLDHWDPGAISRFLRLNAQATFGSTPQAVGMIPRENAKQVRALWPSNGAAPQLQVAGARVEAIPLQHGETQNLAFRILVGNRTVMHLGDAQPDLANFDKLLALPPPDVALVPFWWLLNEQGLAFLTQRWKPRNVVAIHFGAADAATSAPTVQTNSPEVWLCTRPGDSRTY